MIRYAFGYSSNGWLELQWYMFAILVMFGASYTFKRNEHVRVEILYLMLSERGQLWLDLIGTLFFLIPSCLLLSYLSWPFFHAGLRGRRDVEQCRRPGPLADQVRRSRRLRPAGAARRLRGDQAHRRAARATSRSMRNTRGRRNDHAGDDAAADVRRPGSGDADRLPGGLHAGRARAVVRLPVDPSRLLRPELPAGDSGPHLRQRAVQRIAAGDPLLHLHGRDPRALRPRRRHAGFDGPAVRPDPRRPRLFRHHRRLHPRRHHRHGGGAGHRHGADLDAGDDPLRLQHALHHRRAGGLRHHHPAGAALAGADRAGRPARQVGRRHVSRRLGTVGVPDRPVRRLHLRARPHQARSRAAGAEGRADADRLAAVAQMPDGHHSLGRADLRRARHHDAGPGDADRSRRHGRDRRHRARRDPPQGFEQRRGTRC